MKTWGAPALIGRCLIGDCLIGERSVVVVVVIVVVVGVVVVIVVVRCARAFRQRKALAIACRLEKIIFDPGPWGNAVEFVFQVFRLSRMTYGVRRASA